MTTEIDAAFSRLARGSPFASNAKRCRRDRCLSERDDVRSASLLESQRAEDAGDVALSNHIRATPQGRGCSTWTWRHRRRFSPSEPRLAFGHAGVRRGES